MLPTATGSGVVLQIKVGIRRKQCGWGAEVECRRCEDWSAEGVEVWGGGVPLPTDGGTREGVVPLPRKFFAFRSQTGEVGAFQVIFLQFSCLFTAYANIMPVCVIDSETILRHKKRLNSLSCAFIFTSFIYDNWGEYTPTEITGGRYTVYTCIYPGLQPWLQTRRQMLLSNSQAFWKPVSKQAHQFIWCIYEERPATQSRPILVYGTTMHSAKTFLQSLQYVKFIWHSSGKNALQVRA